MTESSRKPHLMETNMLLLALKLMGRAWLPLLLVAALTVGLSVLALLPQQYGAALALRQHPLPELPAPYTSVFDLDPQALDEYDAALTAADDAQQRTARPWQLLGQALDIIGTLGVLPVFVCGLYHCLLNTLRTGACRVRDLFACLRRWGTAAAIEIQVALRSLIYVLLGVIIYAGLTAILGTLGSWLGLIPFTGICIWVMLRFMLAKLHLADAPQGTRSASDCIKAGVEDVKLYTTPAMLVTLWPALLLELGGGILERFVDAPWAAPVSMLLMLLSVSLMYACGATIYERVRYELSQHAATPTGDGLARAKALAAQSDADE